MLDAAEITLLERSLKDGVVLRIAVSECRFACCGRGFRDRSGYEQTYVGTVAHIELSTLGSQPSSVRLNGLGMGLPSFILEAEVRHIDRVAER